MSRNFIDYLRRKILKSIYLETSVHYECIGYYYLKEEGGKSVHFIFEQFILHDLALRLLLTVQFFDAHAQYTNTRQKDEHYFLAA